MYWWLGLFLGSCYNLRVKHKKYTIKFKEEVVRYVKEHSVNETADKFGIHGKRVQEWKKKENCLNAAQRKHARTFRSTSSFQVQSSDVKCFQVVEKISPLFSTTFKNYSRLSNYPAYNLGVVLINPQRYN